MSSPAISADRETTTSWPTHTAAGRSSASACSSDRGPDSGEPSAASQLRNGHRITQSNLRARLDSPKRARLPRTLYLEILRLRFSRLFGTLTFAPQMAE